MQIPYLRVCGYYNSAIAAPWEKVSDTRIVSEYEIEYIQENGGMSIINDKEYPILADSIIVAKPGDKRYSIFTKPLVSIYLRLHAEGEVQERIDSLPSAFPLLKASQVKSVMTDIVSHFAPDKTNDFYITGKLFLLLDLLSNDSMNDNKNLASLYPRMHLAKKFIETNFQRQIKTDDIAESIYMSESHFRFSFRELYGITPHDYLVQTRIDEAKKLLANTILSYSEIADCCHLGSQKNFSTLFKKKTGFTPTGYRKAASKQYTEGEV